MARLIRSVPPFIHAEQKGMGTIFNRKRQKRRRQALRNRPTLTERILWYAIKQRQLQGYKFRRQHGIGYYIVDFYCPELKLAIEADGESHEDEGAKRRDARRQQIIEREGVTFLRFRDEEILGNADLVIKRMEAEIQRLVDLHRPPPPSSSRRRGALGEGLMDL